MADHIGCKNAGEAAVDAYFGHEVSLSGNAAPWGFMSAPIRCLLGSISGMGHAQPIAVFPWDALPYPNRIRACRRCLHPQHSSVWFGRTLPASQNSVLTALADYFPVPQTAGVSGVDLALT
jgi:hypothetical protein